VSQYLCSVMGSVPAILVAGLWRVHMLGLTAAVSCSGKCARHTRGRTVEGAHVGSDSSSKL
jgi:hypothetical protein